MNLDRKPEVLAPAGTLETVKAVIEAGADAVYLGGKSLNMRMHRSSYNLTDAEIEEAVAYAHERGKRIYITLNNLVLERELDPAREALGRIGKLGPDAIIVQDLGVAALARELCVQVPLHSSTMMNIHSAESALALKLMGFSRIIPSRDIPLHEMRRMSEVSGLEIEFFVHGDMCICHSGQCLVSGIVFGESSNRGKCMKPCRWEWELVNMNGYGGGEDPPKGYLLARKDLCLFQYIPDLVRNGIVSLKIEGRMRTSEFLKPLVSAYREAVDGYFENPRDYAARAETMDELWNARVREFTTAFAFGHPGPDSVDPSGKREPRFFSMMTPEPRITERDSSEWRPFDGKLELVAHVSGEEAAEAAAEAGADAIYIGGDQDVRQHHSLNIERLASFIRSMKERRIRVAVVDRRVSDERDIEEWRWLLGKLRPIPSVEVMVSNLGALKVAREMRMRSIIADLGFNTTNSVAADELSTMGVSRVTASIELALEELSELVSASRVPVEVIGQGPLPGMVLEQCAIAEASGGSTVGVCPMPCRRTDFLLRDRGGMRYRIRADHRCRNHIYLPADVCVIHHLDRIAGTGAAGVRIEAQFDRADSVKEIVALYRAAIDSLRSGDSFDTPAAVTRIEALTERKASDGPYAFDLLS